MAELMGKESSFKLDDQTLQDLYGKMQNQEDIELTIEGEMITGF